MISLGLHGIFLKEKSHVFEHFKEFQAYVEKNYSQPIKFFISNNKGEYVSRQFDDYLA